MADKSRTLKSDQLMLQGTEMNPEIRAEFTKKLGKIGEALQRLDKIETSPQQTNHLYRSNTLNPSEPAISLNNILMPELLISILGELTAKRDAYDAAASYLKLKSYPVFKHAGYTYEAWENDIKKRLAILTNVNKRAALSKAKEDLSQFLSTEDKLKNVLSNLDSILEE